MVNQVSGKKTLLVEVIENLSVMGLNPTDIVDISPQFHDMLHRLWKEFNDGVYDEYCMEVCDDNDELVFYLGYMNQPNGPKDDLIFTLEDDEYCGPTTLALYYRNHIITIDLDENDTDEQAISISRLDGTGSTFCATFNFLYNLYHNSIFGSVYGKDEDDEDSEDEEVETNEEDDCVIDVETRKKVLQILRCQFEDSNPEIQIEEIGNGFIIKLNKTK